MSQLAERNVGILCAIGAAVSFILAAMTFCGPPPDTRQAPTVDAGAP